MNNTDLSAELVFNNLKDSIQSMAKDLLKGKIDKKAYTQTDASQISNSLCEEILRKLSQMNKNFKYIVNCIILQKSECGLSLSGSCFWDNETDGSVTIKEETQHIIGIVNIFGVSL